MGGRWHSVPEIQDYPWFPTFLRDAVTAQLRAVCVMVRPFEAAAPVLRGLLPLARPPPPSAAATTTASADPNTTAASPPPTTVVDLCSGGGGALVDLMRRPGLLPDNVCASLTDLFPNEGALAYLERALPGRVHGVRTPVDAGAVPRDAGALTHGVRTIFNALHHLPPAAVEACMRDAAAARQPFAAFEIVERHFISMLTMVVALPFAPLLLGLFIRPLTFSGLFFTYLVPIVPFVVAADGFLSCLRAYSVEELETFCAKANAEAAADAEASGAPAYVWSVGVEPRGFCGLAPTRVIWLEGRPTTALPADGLVEVAAAAVVAQGGPAGDKMSNGGRGEEEVTPF